MQSKKNEVTVNYQTENNKNTNDTDRYSKINDITHAPK